MGIFFFGGGDTIFYDLRHAYALKLKLKQSTPLCLSGVV